MVDHIVLPKMNYYTLCVWNETDYEAKNNTILDVDLFSRNQRAQKLREMKWNEEFYSLIDNIHGNSMYSVIGFQRFLVMNRSEPHNHKIS